jgi:hypothetical protein
METRRAFEPQNLQRQQTMKDDSQADNYAPSLSNNFVNNCISCIYLHARRKVNEIQIHIASKITKIVEYQQKKPPVGLRIESGKMWNMCIEQVLKHRKSSIHLLSYWQQVSDTAIEGSCN